MNLNPFRRRAFPGDVRHWPGLFTATAAFFAYVYLPILILVALSFNENRTVTVWTGFSLDWYRMAFANRDIVGAATNSLIIASIASVSATTLATLAALRMASSDRFLGKTGINAVFALPITVPEIPAGRQVASSRLQVFEAGTVAEDYREPPAQETRRQRARAVFTQRPCIRALR